MKKLKIGDNVKVILGKDKGKIGTIKTIYHKKNTLIIEGINTKIKHVKPSRKEEAGKIITFDAPINCSNVMICDEAGETTRVGFTMQENKKLRISPRNIQLAVKNDEEFNKVLGKATIASGGVVPNVHAALIKSKKQ